MRSNVHSFLCTKSISPSTTKEGRRCRPKFKRHVLHALDEVEHWMSPARICAGLSLLSPCQSASAGLSSSVSILPADSFILPVGSLRGRLSSQIPLPEVRRDSALAGGLSHRLPHQTSPTLRRLWRIATSGEGGRGRRLVRLWRRNFAVSPKSYAWAASKGPNLRLFNLRQLHGVPLSYE